jgi:photosystem II stability/assembly factor-like uncharacterized protein
MKKTITLITIFYFTLLSSSYAQWTNYAFGNMLDVGADIHFLDANTGFVVGQFNGGTINYNRIYRSTNGGTSFTKVLEIADPTSGSLNYSHQLGSLFFTSNNTGFCIGSSISPFGPVYPFICKTINGGLSWDTLSLLQYNKSVGNIYFPSSNIGFISGTGCLYKTIDGGVNWTDITSNLITVSNNGGFSDVHFIDNLTGYISTSATFLTPAGIYRTSDGGTTWAQVFTIGSNFGFTTIQFINSTTGFAGSNQGRVYKTLDGGLTWTLIPISTLIDVRDVFFFTSQLGFAAAGTGTGFLPGAIYKTTNGGSTWTLDNSGGVSVTTTYYSLSFAGGKGFGCGIAGYSVNNSAPLVGIEELNSVISSKMYPNPAKDNAIFEVENNNDIMNLSLTDVMGKKVKNMSINSTINHIQLSDLKSGIYFYELQSENKIVKTGKLIIE